MTRPLIEPSNEETRRKEIALSDGLCDAEAEAASKLIQNSHSDHAVLNVIENAVEFAETMTKQFRHPENPPVACRKSCSWCCYQTVPVSAPEVFRIVDYLRRDADTNNHSLVLSKLRNLDVQTRGVTSSARAKLKMQCAFLQDGNCIIYPVRPLACAEFTSYDVEDCKRGHMFGFKMGSVIHEKARMIVFNAVQQGLFRGLREGIPVADNFVLELTAAVLKAIDSPNGPSDWVRGSPLFADAHLQVEPEDVA